MSVINKTKLSPAEYAAKIINQTNRHVFLTGKAGTGKTTFLRNIILNTHKKTIIVAPTGIAAINAGGVTIHSQFQLPFGAFIPSREFNVADYPQLKLNNPTTLVKHHIQLMNGLRRKVLQELELLIIDEVSMLRADLLDAISLVLKTSRRSPLPFGGVQVLFIGDLLQLPPVVKDEEWRILQHFYNNILFFEAEALRDNKPVYIELDKIYRQNDPVFIDLLNNLRNNQVSEADVELLNRYYNPDLNLDEIKNTILLTTHNNKADARNKAALAALGGKSFFYSAQIEGEFSEYAYPADPRLELKAGAQIMFIKNDPTGQQRFFNGRIATVISLRQDEITAQFDDTKETLQLEKYEWKNIRYELSQESGEIEEKKIGSFTQYPVKLAWAITVHKSQGLTFEKAILDINYAFAPGQIYVALSRLKSLDGLTLTAPARQFIIRKEDAVSSFEQTKKHQGDIEEIISNEVSEYLKAILLRSFDFTSLYYSLKEHSESYHTPETAVKKQKYHSWAKELLEFFDSQRVNADIFSKEIIRITSLKNEDYLNHLYKRVEAALNYFTPFFKTLMERVASQKIAIRKEKKVKGYLSELEEVEATIVNKLREINKSFVFLQSLANNTDFNKEAIQEAYRKVDNEIKVKVVHTSDNESHDEEENESKDKKKKDKVSNSKAISYDLFKLGLTVPEIAHKRDFTVSTVEAHLAYYISTGELEMEALMTPEKASKIKVFAESMRDPESNFKARVGKDISYSDLKYANAWRKLKEATIE